MNNWKQEKRAYLLCRYARESSLYTSWIGQLPLECVAVQDGPTDWHVPADAAIVITHEHFRWEEVSTLRRIYEWARVPTLLLADGVLEFRNTWQNPTIPDGSMYQPLLAHKIACIGDASARLIESWGNPGKSEVVGLPRLDALIGRTVAAKRRDEFNILIATATTPAFNQQQRNTVVESLSLLKSAFDRHPEIAGRRMNVTWRLTDGIGSEIGLDVPEDSDTTLIEAIEWSDAVITTPSTIYLESAILQRPTAILDFNNSPQFVPSAWTISSPDHFDSVLRELADPPPSKILFQEFVLREHLSCQTPAAPRLIELVTRMVELGELQRAGNQPISMPSKILSREDWPVFAAAALDMRGLYPDNKTFQLQEVARLQSELNQAIKRLGSMPRELSDRNIQITQLQSALDESRRRVADVRARLFKLRKILGIGKENEPDGDE